LSALELNGRQASMPSVESSLVEDGERWLCVYDLESGDSRRASRTGLNVWEAAWAGTTQAVALVSDRPVEDAWYSAALVLIDLVSGEEDALLSTDLQLAAPAASPSGDRLGVIEQVADTRGAVAGEIAPHFAAAPRPGVVRTSIDLEPHPWSPGSGEVGPAAALGPCAAHR
jgi:hypothetical protein